MIDKIERYPEVHLGDFREIFFHRGDLTHVYVVKGFPESNYHFHLTFFFLRTFKLYFLANFNYTIQSHQP